MGGGSVPVCNQSTPKHRHENNIASATCFLAKINMLPVAASEQTSLNPYVLNRSTIEAVRISCHDFLSLGDAPQKMAESGAISNPFT